MDNLTSSLRGRKIAEIESEAKKKGKSIFENYEHLGKILERHEDTIQKRWAKKTRKQRLKILLDAWPDMPAARRPAVDFIRGQIQRRSKPIENRDSIRDLILLSYINQEDLAKPKQLLLLLNARGRHLPSSFLGVDSDDLPLAIMADAVVPVLMPGFTLVLRDVTSGDKYGNLYSLDGSDPKSWGSTRTGPQPFPGSQFEPWQGVLLLELQEKLMKFLVECCHQILHEIPPEDMVSDAYPIQPEPSLRTDAETNGYESLAVITAEAPYRAPVHVDFARFESLLAAKASAVADHIWAMREDPNYFVDTLMEVRDHRKEMMKDENGRPHPHATKGNVRHLWRAVIGEFLPDDYILLEIFSDLRDQAKNLATLQRKYAPVISPKKDLPDEYLSAIRQFLNYLVTSNAMLLDKLSRLVIHSAPLREFFTMDHEYLDGPEDIPMNRQEESLVQWVFRLLFEDPDQRAFAGLPRIYRENMAMNELERLLDTDPALEKLVTPYVRAAAGDLAIIAQCAYQLQRMEPWSEKFVPSPGEQDEAELDEFLERKMEPWLQITGAYQGQPIFDLVKLGEPIPGRFTYPVQRRRNKENVDAMRRAEYNLDAFWAQADRHLYGRTTNLGPKGSAVVKLLSQPPNPGMGRTYQTDKATKVPDVEQPISPFYFGLPGNRAESEAASRPSPPPAKAKVKTRGTAGETPGADDVTEAIAETTLDDVQPTFRVDQRALKVFRVLFYNPEVASTSGEIPWNDFLHALASVGLSAQKLYGIVWQFSPAQLDVDASIHFHEPHPKGKLPFMAARRYGRRLHRTYGWTGDLFVLDK
ncbi:hypothetical protein NW762_007202 [Fusarium torreyae]|uniref:Uncharacterized protein n=1 Tax=Fusarium torreyae TaxID=1237075 RepID=A0A9W8S017_9HYPO|nr:hypothetical protein NW762_007202 [Fusarium torreyae]